MNPSLAEEVRRLGGDPNGAAWLWLLEKGPHGLQFSWSQRRDQPPGYVAVEHLQRIVEEREENDPAFVKEVRIAVAAALSSENAIILRRGIQIAAVLGGAPELETVSRLTKSEDESVAADAKASVFYLKRRIKARG